MPSQSRRPLAPTTSSRPKQRPQDLAILAGRQAETPQDFGQAGTTAGMYDGLGMEDKTDDFGKLAARNRRGEPSGVILHQTMSTSAASTESAYASRVKNGKHTGAHYLIDEDGGTALTVPTDKVVYHAVGHNSSSIGIETVGMPEQVSQRSNMHAQIEAIDLSPNLKARLLAMSESELKRTMSANGNYIYKDITGPQKRANWNLLRAIAAEHGIEMKDGVDAHEHVQAKTIGEGENIEEFVDAMLAWPGKIAQLEAKLADAKSSGAPPDYITALETEITEQKSTYEAVKVDKSQQENNALEGEALLGEGGPATERESVREAFWSNFYPHMERLDRWLESSSAAPSMG